MNTAIDNCVCLINNNGGFTVVGWFKRVIINGRSLISERNSNYNGNHHITTEEDVKINSGYICYHFVQIIPTNHEFIDPRIPLYQQLSELMYDLTKIQNS